MIIRQAILTKYIGPTNHRGTRYKAMAAAGCLMLSADYKLNPEHNHAKAAQALAEKLGWDGKWVGGCLPNGDYVFTLLDERLSGAPEAFTIHRAEAA